MNIPFYGKPNSKNHSDSNQAKHFQTVMIKMVSALRSLKKSLPVNSDLSLRNAYAEFQGRLLITFLAQADVADLKLRIF
jgi:hypothetical protein